VLLECNPTPKQKLCLQWEGGTWSTSHRFVEFLFISLLRKKKYQANKHGLVCVRMGTEMKKVGAEMDFNFAETQEGSVNRVPMSEMYL